MQKYIKGESLHCIGMNKIQEMKIQRNESNKAKFETFHKINMMRRLSSLVLKHKQHKNKHKNNILYFFSPRQFNFIV